MPCHVIPASPTPDNLDPGDMFYAAEWPDSGPFVVQEVQPGRIDFYQRASGWWATPDEFLQLRPYCPLSAYLAFRVEWMRVNGVPVEEARAIVAGMPAIYRAAVTNPITNL